MYRRYLKLAGTVAFGLPTLIVLSGCWSQSPRPADQTYTRTTYMAQQGAPVYSSDSEWQRGLNPGPAPKTGQPVAEAAGSQAQPQQTQQPTHVATTKKLSSDPCDSSYTLHSPRMSHSAANCDTQPYDQRTRSQSTSTTTTHSRSTASSAAMMPTTPMITEGSNSGGQWNPGLTQGTLGPEASTKEGWQLGYHNADYRAPIEIHESSGAANSQIQPAPAHTYQTQPQQRQQIQSSTLLQVEQQQLSQQLNQQQQQLNRLKQQLSSDQQALTKQDQEITQQEQELVTRQQQLNNQRDLNKQRQELIKQQQELNRQQQELNKKQQQLNEQKLSPNPSARSNNTTPSENPDAQ